MNAVGYENRREEEVRLYNAKAQMEGGGKGKGEEVVGEKEEGVYDNN